MSKSRKKTPRRAAAKGLRPAPAEARAEQVESTADASVGNLSTVTTDPPPPARGKRQGGPGKSAASKGETLFAEHYTDVRQIAVGGMGIVYRAVDQRLGRPVALKRLRAGASDERFRREAKLLANVSSPHVVQVYDLDLSRADEPILCMEWIEGASLAQRIDDARVSGQPLGGPQVLDWMREVCEGMSAAAESGIVHRDLKPSNILIDKQRRARVADFGLAMSQTSLHELSLALQVLGTPHYMSPEQAEDPRTVDTRADIYSFGATFYHVLTGRPPFDGATVFAVLRKHSAEPLVCPRVHNPELSNRMCELLERCLAKSPGDRFSSFAEVRAQLVPSAAQSPWNDAIDEALVPLWRTYQARRAAYLDPAATLDGRDEYRFPGLLKLRIVRGDLTRLPLDAVVSSDSERLEMGNDRDRGSARSIRLAAGEAVAAEAKRFAPVRVGRVVVTSAGGLPARFIFHGVTFAGDAPVSRDAIAEIVRSCFYQAESLHLRSLGFPLLGTSQQHFPPEICLDTMFRAIATASLHPSNTVESATIVLKPRPVA
ncbi:MAG: serine/threonine-protein kinase [Pirellulaceae bacterium]|nr:serine/threonine-protein kinase [Pirellulaceae bacterium]